MKPARARTAVARAHPPHRVRIIGGRWKRTPLDVPDAPGLRPTPDRVRETVFNWLGQDLTGRTCLDLFAGSGALGFEAASRGARYVLAVERDRAACAAIRRSIEKLDAREIELRPADALATLSALAQAQARFDVVFLDPPFHAGLLERVLAPAAGLLAPDGLLYVEAEREITADEAQSASVRVRRHERAGQVHYHVLERADA